VETFEGGIKMTAEVKQASAVGGAEAPANTGEPANARKVLITLVVVAAVANLPLAMANVALPSIGAYFNASQIELNLVAVAYSLGLACSVLWLGALGDRYGRKMMALLGVSLAIPAALISGFAPTIEVLFFGRLFGGFAAGMAYPTTLALIAALWGPGPARTRSIALWAALGGAISVSGPLLSGILLKYTTWPWVFLIVIPLAVLAIFMALRNIPAHVNETTEKVDNFGGILSVILVGSFVLALNFITMAQYKTIAIELLVVALIAAVVFIIRQRRAQYPLYDLKIAARPTFWVAAVAGIIIFGSLMGAMFIGQQYMQDVLGFGTVESAIPGLFAGACMIVAAPRSAKMVEAIGSRATLLRGYAFILIAFLIMLFLWKEASSIWVVVIAFMFVGVGIGLSGTPASRSLTSSVPVMKAGMASGTADLQRDLGGAIFTALFGAFLAAGYAAAMTSAIAAAPEGAEIPPSDVSSMTMSYAGAQSVAEAYPQYADTITAAAKESFLAGDSQAYIAGIIAVLLGAALVFFLFPKAEDERKLLEEYHVQDSAAKVEPAAAAN
jgi:DHA2 family multidrug resistance protein-like MFS transporter